MITLFIACTVALVLSLVLTPGVILLARKIGAMDKPDERKVHHIATPRLGGVAIFLSCLATLIFLRVLFPEVFSPLSGYLREVLLVSASLLTVFVLGLRDDLKPLGPGFKFLIQFSAATLLYMAGFSISHITNPWSDGMFNLVLLEFPLTLLWIVGITNAFNLIDGLDGLASGVASIAAASIVALALYSGDLLTALFMATLVGALLGFLRYNFHPASIFLGDSGSLFIGFSLALLSIQSAAKISTGLTVLFPFLVLILPITDTVISMARRFFGSFLSDRNRKLNDHSLIQRIYGMFKPDRSHIHHQLMILGFTHRNTVLLLYGVSALFAAGAFLFVQVKHPEQSMAILLVLGLLLYLGVKQLRYREIAILNNGLMIPVTERWVVNRTLILSLLDLIFATLSATVALYSIQSFGSWQERILDQLTPLAWIIIIQVILFHLTGIYREKIRQIGLGNMLSIIATVFYATLGASLYLLVFVRIPLPQLVPFLLINFYLLITFTLGIRMAYQVLIYWFDREKTEGAGVLIYGASRDAVMMLKQMSKREERSYRILGFLDDDPALEGKRMDGYPVLGGHWKLEKLIRRETICCIFVCDERILPENFRRMKAIAAAHNILVKRLYIQQDNIPLEGRSSGNENKAITGTVMSTV